MADIPGVVWELAAYIHDELYYHKDKYPDETSQLWFLRESIDGIRCDAEKPYQAQDDALKARIRELEAENARLKFGKGEDVIAGYEGKLLKAEAANAKLREALGAADNKIIGARNYLTASANVRPKEKRAKAEKELGEELDETRALIEAALKGV
jgi:hypothetical protein